MPEDETNRREAVEQALPEVRQIDNGLVQRWLEFDEKEELVLHITRGDIDNLFFAVQQLAYGVGAVQRSLYSLTEGQQDHANVSHIQAQVHTTNAVNRMSDFLSSLMGKAEPFDAVLARAKADAERGQ